MEDSELRPEYHSISYQLQALSKMVRDEFGNYADSGVAGLANNFTTVLSPRFERGKFYEEYSARRNERLRKRKGETPDERKTKHCLGVTVESAKRRGDSKKLEQGLRKSMPAGTFSAEQSKIPIPRYSLRSSTKENKKPPLSTLKLEEYSQAGGSRKTRSRVGRKA